MKRSLQLNPDHRPATWDQIRDWRDAHEVAPVSTTYGVFDCNQLADRRLEQAIKSFDILPVIQNGKMTWKTADNVLTPLTKVELQAVYDQVQANRAIRASVLHYKATEFAALDPRPTVAQLKDLNFWLAP